MQFSSDGRLLASSGSDGIAKLWEVAAGGLKFRRTLRGHVGWVDLVFSPDCRRAVTSGTENSLKLWDTKTGLEVGTLYGHRGKIVGSVRCV